MDASALTSPNIQIVFAFIIVVLAGVVVYLYRDNRKLQDSRLTDAQQRNDKFANTASKLAQAIKALNKKLDGKK